MTKPAQSNAWRVPVAIIAIGLVVAAYYTFAIKSKPPKVRDNIDVVITKVDVDRSTISADFIHPRDGKTYPIVAHLDKQCEITIDGVKAEIGELAAGDRAIGKGTLQEGVVNALAIRVIRNAAATSARTEDKQANGRTDANP